MAEQRLGSTESQTQIRDHAARETTRGTGLVRRQFTTIAQDVLWVGDVTEIPTLEGKLYSASVEDRFSGRLLGYATSAHHDAELACAAL